MNLAEIKSKVALSLRRELGLCGAVVVATGKEDMPATTLKKPTVLVDILGMKAGELTSEFEAVAYVRVPIRQRSKLDECVWAAVKGFAGQKDFSGGRVETKRPKFESEFVEQQVIFKGEILEDSLFWGLKGHAEVRVMRGGRVIGTGSKCRICMDCKVGRAAELGGTGAKLMCEEPMFRVELEELLLENFCDLFLNGKPAEIEVCKDEKVYRFCGCVLEKAENEFAKKRLKSAQFVSLVLEERRGGFGC